MLHNPRGSCRIRTGLLAVTVAAAPVFAHAVPAQEILFAALATGTSQGEVTGNVATKWMNSTRSSQPIQMTAKVIRRYQQEGCGRLGVTMTQQGAPTRDGGTAPVKTYWEVNLCRDGSPPREGADIGAISRSFAGGPSQ